MRVRVGVHVVVEAVLVGGAAHVGCVVHLQPERHADAALREPGAASTGAAQSAAGRQRGVGERDGVRAMLLRVQLQVIAPVERAPAEWALERTLAYTKNRGTI